MLRVPACVRWFLFAALALFGTVLHAQPLRVAAASDLQFALPAIADRFTKDIGHAVQVSYGSSGNFARQIRQGAPFDVFLSADESFVFGLADAGLTRDRGAPYAIGRLAVVVPRDSPLTTDPELADIARRMDRISRFAIANPEHAPYGRAASDALASLGLWDSIRPKLVLGENVAQAARYVTTRDAQAGIVARSMAWAPEIARVTRHADLPVRLHPPLVQRGVVLAKAGPRADAFFRWMLTPEVAQMLHAAGFDPVR